MEGCLMKKVGIITILKVNNYGAELQAYATQKVMNLMGYDAEIIDYIYYRNLRHRKERCSYPFFPYPLKNRLKEWGLRLLDRKRELLLSGDARRRGERFDSFHAAHNRLSHETYDRYSALYANPPRYDAYCVGSDQVWNPRCYTNLSPYFLTFAPEGAVRFSYASSFGVSELPGSARGKYAECLNNLSCISVREKAGVDLVKKLTGRDAQLVADPTLLLGESEWAEVERKVDNMPERFVLVYELHPLPRIMELALKVAGQKGGKVVRLCKDEKSTVSHPNVINVTDAGPSEFVYLFRHAGFVVTNSFHGAAFSVNFRKDFYCVLSRGLKNNSRQINLLTLCGLMERICYTDEQMPAMDNLQIDYANACQGLQELITKSKQFIKNAIDGDK